MKTLLKLYMSQDYFSYLKKGTQKLIHHHLPDVYTLCTTKDYPSAGIKQPLRRGCCQEITLQMCSVESSNSRDIYPESHVSSGILHECYFLDSMSKKEKDEAEFRIGSLIDDVYITRGNV